MQPNQKIVSNNKEPLEWLIVDVFEEEGVVALSDLLLKKPKRPFRKKINVIQEMIAAKKVVVEQHHFPAELYKKDSELPTDWIDIRDKAWAAISPLAENPEVKFNYLFGDKTGILESLILLSCRSKKFVTGSLNRYFALGGFKNSVLPHYFNSGSNFFIPETVTYLDDGSVSLASKRGKKPPTAEVQSYALKIKIKPHRGITRSDIRDIEKFSKSIESGMKVVLSDLYVSYCKKFCVSYIKPKKQLGLKDEKISAMPVPHGKAFRISPESFKRQLKKFVSEINFIKKEKGSISFERDNAGKPGVAREQLRGVTCRYEIDATILDIYVRYPYSNDEQLATGRPVIFIVIDTMSGMIVGFHIDFKGPDWHGASQALFNAMSNKVDYCAQFGIHISEDDWPCHHPCRELTFDRGGENTDNNIESMLKGGIGVTVGNFNAYHRGDAKGTVEKVFDVLQKKSLKFNAGLVVKVPSKEAPHASRKAIYTLDEIREILIRRIIHLNNYQPRIDSHNFEMSRDDVEFTSRAIWDWSLENAVVRPSVTVGQLRFALMPVESATVWDKGVYFRGLFYSCNYIVKEEWLTKAKVSRYKVEIRYSSASTQYIWWRDKESKELIQLELTTRSEAYRNQEWAHVMHRLEIVKLQLEAVKEKEFVKRIELELSLDEMEDELRELNKKRSKSEAKGMQSGMKEKKVLEGEAMRHKAFEATVADINAEKNNACAEGESTPSDTSQDLTDPTILPI